MLSFLIQIVTSVFIGVCFVYLAKRYQKNEIQYFIFGFLLCFGIRVGYLFVYGYFNNFTITQSYSEHKSFSILVSIIVSYIVFTLIRKRIKKKNTASLDINEIGK
ncbi:hypothetical protein DUT90_04280 [Polaribacter sp. WD7]|nr:hypothetical protein DUT90_04280 [Polaribacter sp. WD7]